MDFKEVKIKDISTILNGRAYKQNELLEYGKYKILRVGNFFTSDKWYFSDMELEENKYCDYGDLLFAWSANFGPKIWNEGKTIYHYHIWKFELKENVDKNYLYYYLKFITNKLKNSTHGSVMLHLTKSDMENQIIKIPNYSNQMKIGTILSKIDDKIELNNKINDNLLKIIDSVYKKEFAELEEFDKAENIANITIGKTPPRSISECFSQNDKDIKWVSISDLGRCGTYVNDTSERLTIDAVDKYNVKIIPKETVILSFKLTVGRVAITRDEMATNEAIAHFNLNNKDMKYFTYCYLKNFDFESLGSTSSIATAVNSKIIKAMPIAIPNSEKLIKFNNIVKSLFERVKNNEIENETLSDLRDTLLPKLMNGEIDLDKIEI